MKCKACFHPQRNIIDQQIIAGRPLRALVAAFGISLGALHRHKTCIRELLTESRASEREERGSALQERVLRLCDEAEKILTAASAKNDFRGANGALGASAKLIDLLARLSGELQSANSPGLHFTKISNTINIYNDDRELAELVAEATGDFNPVEIARLKNIVEKQRSCALDVQALPQHTESS